MIVGAAGEALPLAGGLTAVFGFSALLARLILVASRDSESRGDQWEALLRAANARAEAAEDRANRAEEEARSAKRKVLELENQIDELTHQMGQVQWQLAGERERGERRESS